MPGNRTSLRRREIRRPLTMVTRTLGCLLKRRRLRRAASLRRTSPGVGQIVVSVPSKSRKSRIIFTAWMRAETAPQQSKRYCLLAPASFLDCKRERSKSDRFDSVHGDESDMRDVAPRSTCCGDLRAVVWTRRAIRLIVFPPIPERPAGFRTFRKSVPPPTYRCCDPAPLGACSSCARGVPQEAFPAPGEPSPPSDSCRMD